MTAVPKYSQDAVYHMTNEELMENSISLEELHENLVNRIHQHYHPEA